jgi:hypothetical protein
VTVAPTDPLPDPTSATRRHGTRLGKLLIVAGVLGVLGLGLSVLPMAGITPFRLALSFGIGQPLCVVALMLYAVAVLLDLRKRRVL